MRPFGNEECILNQSQFDMGATAHVGTAALGPPAERSSAARVAPWVAQPFASSAKAGVNLCGAHTPVRDALCRWYRKRPRCNDQPRLYFVCVGFPGSWTPQ
jgi:hypothetical protein